MRVVTHRPAALALVLALGGTAACAVAIGAPDLKPGAPVEPSTASASASAPPGGATAAPPAAPVAAAAADGWSPCGALTCKRYASPAAALAALVEVDKPQVLGLGEAHAQKGTEDIASTASRTTSELLPVLGGKATNLVLELWVPDASCNKKTQEKVVQQQKPVTQNQAASNQNEYVTLAEKAKALGIQPHVLRPTCAEVEAIAKAGDDAILEMLTLITRHMEEKLLALRAQPGAADRMIVTYGGALHNDLVPQEGREGWSFGPAVSKATVDRYVELDLVVPEYIKETPAWTGQRWYAAWQAVKDATPPEATTAVRVAPRSYALVLPRGVKR
jgi:hypothetical protein